MGSDEVGHVEVWILMRKDILRYGLRLIGTCWGLDSDILGHAEVWIQVSWDTLRYGIR